MKAKLIIEGKEIEVEISQEEYEKIQPKKATGYERCTIGGRFYVVSNEGRAAAWKDLDYPEDRTVFEVANYYTNLELAQANARADKLMRNLRRYSAMHRESDLDWKRPSEKWCIYFDYGVMEFRTYSANIAREFGAIYFCNQKTAKAAIKEFHDELMWYFTEYKDSL